MTIKVNLPDGSIVNFPDGTSNEVMESAIVEYLGRQNLQQQDNSVVEQQQSELTPQQLQDEGLVNIGLEFRGVRGGSTINPQDSALAQTIEDVGGTAVRSLAKLPLNVGGVITDMAGAVGGETTAPAEGDGVNVSGRVAQGAAFLGALGNAASGDFTDLKRFMNDPEFRQEFLQTSNEDLRQGFIKARQDIDKKQEQASETSPIATPVVDASSQLLQLLGVGASALPATIGGKVASGAGFGGALSFLETPLDPNLTPEQSLQERARQTAVGGIVGGALGGGLGVVGEAIKSSPAFLDKFSQFAQTVPAYISRGVANLARINPQAANDFMSPDMAKSLAVVSDSPTINRLDRYLSSFAGSAGVMRKNAEKTIANIQKRLENTGSNKAVSIQEAGQLIKKGGENFISKFKDLSDKIYNRLDKKYRLSDETEVPLTNTIKYLDDYLADNVTTPGILEQTRKTGGLELLETIVRDAKIRNGTLDYKGLKRYRSLVGERLAKPANISGDSFSILKTIYGQLSNDMEQVFIKKGDRALQDFRRANQFYSSGLDNIEKNLKKVINSDAPENVYRAALAGTKIGDFKVRSIMKALNPEQREIVRGTVLQRMGLAKPGQQGASGDAFSVNTLLTNWNNLSPEAKIALFGVKNGKTRQSLDLIARQAERIKSVDRFTNTSKTAEQITLGALVLGGVVDTTKALSLAGGANFAARLMTNNNFINLLGKWVTKKPTPNNISKFLDDTQKIVEKNPEIADDLIKYITTIGIIVGQKQQ